MAYISNAETIRMREYMDSKPKGMGAYQIPLCIEVPTTLQEFEKLGYLERCYMQTHYNELYRAFTEQEHNHALTGKTPQNAK